MPIEDKALFFEALFFLHISKLAILIFPLKKLAPYMGELKGLARDQLREDEKKKSLQIRYAISRAQKAVIWKSVCLDQALAAHLMLARKRIPFSICFGVVNNPEQNTALKGHAWIICGGKILVGGQRSKQYAEAARFTKSFPV